MSFAASLVAMLLWLLIPAHAKCQPPGCQVALTPAQDVLWIVGILALPIVVILAVLAIRDARARRRREAGTSGP
jgi:hypothetical protein